MHAGRWKTVLAVGETGLTCGFGVWAGLAPVCGVCGEMVLSWGFSGVGVRGMSGAGMPAVVVGVPLRGKRGQGWCSVASVACRRGRDRVPWIIRERGDLGCRTTSDGLSP